MSLTLDPERAVLGGILADDKLMADITLDPAEFANTNHGSLWRLFTRMWDQGETITPITVLRRLPEITKDAPSVDGSYLADLLGDAPVPTSLASRYALDVVNNAGNRRLISAGRRAMQLGQAGGNAHENQELIRAEVDAATTAVAATGFIGDSINETIDGLSAPSKAIPTPWPDLNHVIKGWRPGAMYIIGARPSVGKTIMGLQAAIGMTDHGAVTFHSLEMSRDELNVRVIAQMAEVAQGRLDGTSGETTGLSERDWQRISAVTPRILEMPLSIDDRSTVTPTDIKSHARSVHRTRPLAGIVVDYLQLMEAPSAGRNSTRQETVAAFSRSLKILAREMGVPVMVLSQLNRGSAQENRRPTMADLRESGAIEQDADVILLLHAEDELSSDLEVIVAKNRHGIKSRIKLTRRGEFSRLDPYHWTPSSAVPDYPAYADN